MHSAPPPRRFRPRTDTRPGLSRPLPLLLHCVIAVVFLVNDIAADPAVSAIVQLEPEFTELQLLGARALPLASAG